MTDGRRKKNFVFDFDGTFYKAPVPQELEDAIDLSMFRLFMDKLKVDKNANEVLGKINKKFKEFDGSSFTQDELIYFSDEIKPFSAYLNKNETDKSKVMITRMLVKMTKSNGVSNHRVSNMLDLGLNISK